jgi:hypothetical protein
VPLRACEKRFCTARATSSFEERETLRIVNATDALGATVDGVVIYTLGRGKPLSAVFFSLRCKNVSEPQRLS